MHESHQRTIRRIALTGALVMLMVTTSSAYLRLRAAGLGCIDWPQCYGQLAAVTSNLGEEWIAAARVVHRFSASVAGLLALLVVLTVMHSKPVHRRTLLLAVTLLTITVGLALLGRVTPQTRVPAVALGNLLGGMGMSALFVAIAVINSSVQRTFMRPTHGILAIVLLGLLIASGALTSATYSGMACTTFPDCSGVWWPRDAGLSDFNPWHTPTQGETLPSAAIHMAHRYLALCTVLVLFALSIRLMRQARVLRVLGSVLLVLALTQVILGISMLARSLPMVFALSHNIVASLLLCALSIVVCAKSAAR